MSWSRAGLFAGIAFEALIAIFCVCASVYGRYDLGARVVMLAVAMIGMAAAIDIARIVHEEWKEPHDH